MIEITLQNTFATHKLDEKTLLRINWIRGTKAHASLITMREVIQQDLEKGSVLKGWVHDLIVEDVKNKQIKFIIDERTN